MCPWWGCRGCSLISAPPPRATLTPGSHMTLTQPQQASRLRPYTRRRIAYLINYKPSTRTGRQVAYAAALWRVHRLGEHPAYRRLIDDLCAVCEALASLYELRENPLTAGRPARQTERVDHWRHDFSALSDRHALIAVALRDSMWLYQSLCRHHIDSATQDGDCISCRIVEAHQ